MKKIVLAFGRLNPPTIGHEKLIKVCADVARKNQCDYHIYVSHSQNKQTKSKSGNPLDPKTKIALIKKMFPSHANHLHLDDKIKSPFLLLKAYNSEYDEVIFVAGGEDAANYETSFNKHMATASPDFYHRSLIVHKAGERSADAEGAEGMSASKMRAFALQTDFASFRQGMPTTISDNECKKVMNEIRDYLTS